MAFSYTTYRFGQLLALTLPLPWSYWIAERIADLQYALRSADRRAILGNVSAIVDDPFSARRLAREIFRNFGKYLVDFLRFPRVDAAFIARRVRVEGLEHLRDTLSRYGGAISVTAHLGNWELAGAVTAQAGFPVAAVALNHRDARVNHFFNVQRRSKGVVGIPPGLALRHCHRFLAQHRVVALLGDRNYTSRGVACTFLSRRVMIPRGPALLSVRTGTPIVPGFLLRASHAQRYVLYFEPPLLPPSTGDREQDIHTLTQRYVAVIERYVKAHPAQWFLFRPFDVPEIADTAKPQTSATTRKNQ